MDSEPNASADAPLPGVGPVAAGLRARRRPLVASFTAARRLSGIGDVGRAAVRFGSLTFLSQSARRRELHGGAGASRLLVRPPDYWSGQLAGDDGDAVQTVRTGDAAYDALLARRARTVRASRPAPPAPRGLPSTVHRRGRSAAGPLTGPGSVLRRLAPTPAPVAPNPATTGGKLMIAATPAPQAPKRSRSRTPANQTRRAPRAGDDRPPRPADSAVGATPTSTVRPTTTTAGSPDIAAQPAGLSSPPPAGPIRTPSFDALLASIAPTSEAATAPPPTAAARIDASARLDAGARIDATTLARVADGIDHRDGRATPPVAVRTLAPLPTASVSVHAAAPTIAAQRREPGTFRRLSFSRASALVGRPPWEQISRQPVSAGVVAAGAAAAGAGSPTAELRRARAGTGVAYVAADDSRRSRSPLTLRRALRSTTAAAAAPSTQPHPARAGTLADAVRRVFGDQHDVGAAPAARAAMAPPAGVPVPGRSQGAAAPSTRPAPTTAPLVQTDRVAARPPSAVPTADGSERTGRVAALPLSGDGPRRRADGSRPAVESVVSPLAPVVPIRRLSAERGSQSPSPAAPAGGETHSADVRRTPAAAGPGTIGADAPSALPGGLLAPLARQRGERRSTASDRARARPGSVLALATTHAPLAHADRRRIERRAGRVDVQGVPVGTPPVLARPAGDASTATERPTVTSPGRAGRGPAGDASTATERATVTSPDPGGRERDAGAATPGAPAAERVTPSPERQSLEAPTAPRTASTASTASTAARTSTTHDAAVIGGAVAARERAGARVAVRRLPLSAGLGTAWLAPGAPARDTTAGAAATAPATEHLARRLAALESPFDLVRRLPVGGLHVATVGRSTDAGATATPSRESVAAAGPHPATGEVARRTARSLGARSSSSLSVAAASISARSVDAGAARSSVIASRRTSRPSLLLPTARVAPATAAVAGTTVAQRLAALQRTGSADLVRRAPVAAPTIARPASGAEPERAPARRDLIRRPLALPNARVLPNATEHAADAARARRRDAHGPDDLSRRLAAIESPGAGIARQPVAGPVVASVAAPDTTERLVRRSIALPNGRALPSAAARAETAAAERRVTETSGERLARLVDAGLGSTDSVHRMPVGAPAVVVGAARLSSATTLATPDRLVRRSMALATAPSTNEMPGTVLPGRRSLQRSPGVRSSSPTPSRPTSTSTADRLREMVATGAFDGTPARRPVDGAAQPAASGATPPVAPPVLRTPIDRFEHVMRSATIADRPMALPKRFRPLAERILGPRIAVQVVHGAVTRKALTAAGHEAATTDRTIHLPSRPDASARTMSIVAHELEHVAAPSPVPRFHGGTPSPEESRAARTEAVVRRLAAGIDARGGPAASAGTAGLPVAGIPGFGRSGSGATPGGPPVPASASRRSDTVRRTPSSTAAATSSAASGSSTIRRMSAEEAIAPAEESGTSDSSSEAPALSPSQLSAIIRAVEDRLLEEIERRGGLSRGAF